MFLDVETTGLDAHTDRLVLVAVAADESEPVCLRHPDDRDEVQSWLDLEADFVGHNVGFDFGFLDEAGYRIPDPGRWHDTTLVAHIAGERPPGQTALRTLTSNLIELGELPAGMRRGVPLDLDSARELRDRTESRLGHPRAHLFELAGRPSTRMPPVRSSERSRSGASISPACRGPRRPICRCSP